VWSAAPARTTPAPPTRCGRARKVGADDAVQHCLHIDVIAQYPVVHRIADDLDKGAGTDVLILVHDLHIRVLTDHGQLLRELQLDPTKNYQPQTKP
jgi:hypothetical protein